MYKKYVGLPPLPNKVVTDPPEERDPESPAVLSPPPPKEPPKQSLEIKKLVFLCYFINWGWQPLFFKKESIVFVKKYNEINKEIKMKI